MAGVADRPANRAANLRLKNEKSRPGLPYRTNRSRREDFCSVSGKCRKSADSAAVSGTLERLTDEESVPKRCRIRKGPVLAAGGNSRVDLRSCLQTMRAAAANVRRNHR